MTSYRYYVIRHKATGEIMPQSRKDKGYSHWNPSHPEHEFGLGLGVPRLIDTRRRAARCIYMWASNPNGKHKGYQNQWTGEWEDDYDIKPDGRTANDLEIVEVDVILQEVE
jgi:hypothetical protein